MKLTAKSSYLFTVSILIALGAIFGPIRNPYGKDFGRIVVPGLLVLNAAQWLVVSSKTRWRIAGALCSFVGSVFIARTYWLVHFTNFLIILLLAMLLQATVLWFFTSGWPEKGVVLAQHLTIAFVVFLAADLRMRGMASHLGGTPLGTAAFLFWSPLIALLMWAGGVAFKKQRGMQVFLFCAILQIGIGLFDLGTNWSVSWGFPCAFLVWFADLGLAAYLARTWQSRHPTGPLF